MISFPKIKGRPFFYTSFVATVDGKTQVTTDAKAYWPIGSKADYEMLLELRAHADILVHGKYTALWGKTLDSLAKETFRMRRRKLGKREDLPYMVITNTPDDALTDVLANPYDMKPYLVTAENTIIPKELEGVVQHVELGDNKVDLSLLPVFLMKEECKSVLVEGGPTLLGGFLSLNLIDEIFLTIAPKIFGNNENVTLTMVEGVLFPPEKVKKLKLLSVKQVEDEVFLQYKVLHG